MIIQIKKLNKIIISVVTIAATVAAAIYIPFPKNFFENAAFISAGLAMPNGIADYIKTQIDQDSEETPEEDSPVNSPAEDELGRFDYDIEQKISPEEGETLENASPSTSETPPEGTKEGGKLIEKQLIYADNSFSFENIQVQNKSKTHTPEIKEAYESSLNLEMSADDKPYVLIFHTHTTEAFQKYDVGWYPEDFKQRDSDSSKNMIRIGDEIVKNLKAAGIGVIHDTKVYDDPMYTGAYERSAETIDEYLEKYPSIQVILDIHRDAIEYDNGSKLKPTAVINGKKAAQIMIISGCQEGAMTGFDNWRENLKFAVKLQKSMEDNYPGLTRPLFFSARKYNMHKSNNSLLIEVGSDGNTLEEAIYSGELFGNCLVEVLKPYIK